MKRLIWTLSQPSVFTLRIACMSNHTSLLSRLLGATENIPKRRMAWQGSAATEVRHNHARCVKAARFLGYLMRPLNNGPLLHT